MDTDHLIKIADCSNNRDIREKAEKIIELRLNKQLEKEAIGSETARELPSSR